jgi:hypothetical protein
MAGDGGVPPWIAELAEGLRLFGGPGGDARGAEALPTSSFLVESVADV